MAYRDLREFLDVLEAEGELLRIKEEVDWNEEIGAVSRRLCDKETQGINSPAVLFENIKGYPGGRFFTNTLASYRRYALALGLKKDTPVKQLIRTYHDRILNPVKPVIVDSGPCKENILKGNNVDLFKFPTPKWHAQDGHRYIGTFHAVITKDPDTDWTNLGLYRLGVHDKASTGVLITSGQHIGLIYQKYQEAKKAMPVAVAIGCEPTLPIVSASAYAAEISEFDMAGGLRQAPVELVKAETNDLLVPANAEIILEGEVPPDELKTEGPFGEWTGYFGGDVFPKPVFHVKCITHRNNPILTGSQEGVPLVDDNLMASISMSALALHNLKDLLKVPGVQDVFFYPHAAGWVLCIVSVKSLVSGLAQQVACAVWGSRFGSRRSFAEWVIVVDEDIDPSNINQVIWAMTTRCDPERSIQIIRRRGQAVPLLPNITFADRVEKQMPSSSIIIDGTFPREWRVADPRSVPAVCNWESWPQKVRERALSILKERSKG